ncbi:GTP binding protein [Aureococcus anophagefferens]|uniref:GTP binding protein n=1 Tax=Aureococcus anophagefferens TaxID=44056 RepID=A0ABR1FT93_AURAN
MLLALRRGAGFGIARRRLLTTVRYSENVAKLPGGRSGKRGARRARHERTLDFTAPRPAKTPAKKEFRVPAALRALVAAHGPPGGGAADADARRRVARRRAGALEADALAAAVLSLLHLKRADLAEAALAGDGALLRAARARAVVVAAAALPVGQRRPARRSARRSSARTSPTPSSRGPEARAAASRPLEPASPLPFNGALRAAREARSLAGVFEVLDAMAAAGCAGDDDTFAAVAHAAARSVQFVTGAVSMDTLPKSGRPEVALVGRSNVGKSSLVNMITNRRSAAFTSKKPGKTQQFNYFDVNAPGDDARRPRFASANDGTAPAPRPRKRPWAPPGRFFLVDVPGSGYALAPGAARDAWAALLERYLAERADVVVVLHLVDARVGAQPTDAELFALTARCDAARRDRGLEPLRPVLVLTKADKKDSKVSLDAQARLRADLAAATSPDRAATTPIVVTSAVSKRGRDDLWRVLGPAVLRDD